MSAPADIAERLSHHIREEIDGWTARFPPEQKRSAILGALRAAQHEHGYLRTDIMDAVAAYLGLAAMDVYEVASFYSMFELKPVGKHNVSVCTNVSCWLRGAAEIVSHIEQRLDIKTGESTADGKFYLKREEECLAGCCGAPMMQIDHVYYENLTPAKVDEILDGIE